MEDTMLRIKVRKSASRARRYYASILARDTGPGSPRHQEEVGAFHGRLARRLSLEGSPITAPVFENLCNNIHPGTGKTLTCRQCLRRRVGFDPTYTPPKGVSIAYLVMGVTEVLPAFRASMKASMSGVEQLAATRIRKGGVQEGIRTTGNLLWAEFIHLTARPDGGIPAPHLHGHPFTFNATLDPMEMVTKAVDLVQVFQRAPLLQALFHAQLAEGLRALGFEITQTGGGWDIAGISAEIKTKFSPRSATINAYCMERGHVSAASKGWAAILTREPKTDHTLEELTDGWLTQLTPDEQFALGLGQQDEDDNFDNLMPRWVDSLTRSQQRDMETVVDRARQRRRSDNQATVVTPAPLPFEPLLTWDDRRLARLTRLLRKNVGRIRVEEVWDRVVLGRSGSRYLLPPAREKIRESATPRQEAVESTVRSVGGMITPAVPPTDEAVVQPPPSNPGPISDEHSHSEPSESPLPLPEEPLPQPQDPNEPEVEI